MIYLTVAFLTGILIQLSLPTLIDPLWLIALLSASIFLVKKTFLWFIIVVGVLVGVLLVSLTGNRLLNNLLPSHLENQILVVQGKVISPPVVTKTKTSFDFYIENIVKQPAFQAKVKLSWYSRMQAVPVLKAGDTYQLQVKLKRPNGFHNVNGFDYQTWLFAQGYAATGYVRKSAKNTLKSSTPCLFSIACLRNGLYKKSNVFFKDSPYKGIYQALVLGIKNNIPIELRKTMVDTGTIHLLAISGLHIGIVALLFFSLGQFIWSHNNFVQNLTIKPSFALLLAFVAALFYALMAGFSLPTQRALLMFSAGLICHFLYRHNALWNSYWLALFLVLLFAPLSPLSAGFWLSFGAVAIIFMVLDFTKNKQYSILVITLLVQLALVIGLLPVLLVSFHVASLNSFVANLFAVPIASFIIIPLSFLMLVVSMVFEPLASVLLWMLDIVLDAYFYFLNAVNTLLPYKWLSNVDYSIIQIALLAIALFILYKIHRYLVLAVIMIVPLVLYTLQPNVPKLKVHIFDVGQGLAILVSTSKHHLLYDTGVAYSEKFTAVKQIIVPYLKRHGIEGLDKLVLSHSDNDHIGDYQSLLKQIKVAKVETGQPDFFKEKFDQCHTEKPWLWDTVFFEYLTAPIATKKDNDFSCVLKITSNKRILITGDIEKSQELALVKKYKQHLKADVLIVPHHGSKTSSSNSFLNYVKPIIALSSNSYLNRFNHPHIKVVNRYAKRAIRFNTTDKQGAITLLVNKQGVDVQTAKQSHFNKWYNFINY